jgi:hypothetical protein
MTDLLPIAAEAREAFAGELAQAPPMSLRAGNAADDYRPVPPYDDVEDRLSDPYLEAHHWGLAHLDPTSFRHYLPALIDYALRHRHDGGAVVDALLFGLRPPDRDPPRFGSLSTAQEQVVVRFLEAVAFTEACPFANDALLALDEWWGPGALYRGTARTPPDHPT